ncbi:lysostaphin resistance A-like protein, partial [Flavobacterium sp.]
FRAVLYEELIFRGALLYLLIQKTGTNRAMLVSSAAFGIYHWFAWQAFGNPVQMLVIFLMTGSCGYIFALAFVRTRSMYLPFALHLGNNITQMILFSGDASIGDQMLLRTFTTDPVVPQAIISIPVLIIHYTGFQLLGWYLLMKVKPDLS